jgi:putative ABC transport system permease protein
VSGSASAFTRRDINKSLKEGGDKVTASSTGKRKREILLAVQFALSFVILTASALIVLSLYRLNNEDAGYEPKQVLVVGMSLNFTNYTNAQQIRDFGTRLLQEVRAISGVSLAGISAETPLDSAVLGPVTFDIEGRTFSDEALRPTAKPTVVSEDYLDVMNITLLKGRKFSSDDDDKNIPVVLINHSFEEKYFPEGNAVGQRISTNNGQSWETIVGVVKNIRARDLSVEEGDTLYRSFRQTPSNRIDLFVKNTGSLEELGEQITHIVHGIDGQQAVDSVRTMEEIKSEWLQAPRLIAALIGLFGILALIVTLSGVIGVVSYNVSQRMREVGIHMAIGATPSHIVGMFLGQGMKIFGAGLVVGLVLLLFAAPSLDALLYKTSSLHPGVYLLTALLLTVVVLAAMFVPARRAANLNPTAALRNE